MTALKLKSGCVDRLRPLEFVRWGGRAFAIVALLAGVLAMPQPAALAQFGIEACCLLVGGD